MRFVAFLLALLAAPLIVHADDMPQPLEIDATCPVPPDEHWKPQEKFVWSKVCLGEEANFDIEQGYGGNLDPKAPAGLPESRVLSSTFLSTILLSDKYRHALTRRGVRITGARFTELVDLQNAELSTELWLDRSLLEKGADLRGLRSTRRITFYGSKITGPLEMAELELRGDLSMAGKGEFAAVYLGFAHVGGTLDLTGSTVAEDLDMAGIQIDHGLFMGKAKFTRVNLTSARVSWLALDDSRVTGLLNMSALRVDNHLVMAHAELADVVLGLARVQGQLTLANSKITGDLVMDGLHVGGELVGMNAQFNRASLRTAVVDGMLSLIGTTVNGDLDMTGLHVGRGLLANSVSEKLFASVPESLRRSFDELGIKADGKPNAILKARFARVALTGASIQGGLALAGATLTGDLLMDGVQIGGDLTMADGEYQAVTLERAHIAGVFNLRGSKLGGQLDCYASEIGSRFDLRGGAEFSRSILCSFAKLGEVDLAGSKFQDNVDLTGCQINGELRIGAAGEARTQWAQRSTLYMRNATADAIQDLPDAWPVRIDLSGFAYHNLGGRNATQQAPMADRPVSWFVNWLGKQDPYAPGPYEQLATVLRSEGRPGAADEILYAGKERERAQAPFLRRAWLTTIDVLIGYGYHLEWAVVWVTAFVLAGIAVLRFSGQGPRNQMPFGIAYSFDMLLPIIRLREKHYQVDLEGWPRYYFYFHKIMGYVLASFLIAGLAGLAK
jgi:hypothetical protein